MSYSLQDLDRALGAAVRCRRRTAPCRRARAPGGCRRPSRCTRPRNSIAGWQRHVTRAAALARSIAELLEPRRGARAASRAGRPTSTNACVRRQRDDVAARRGVAVARLELLAHLASPARSTCSCSETSTRHAARRAEEVERPGRLARSSSSNRSRTGTIEHLIGGAGRSLVAGSNRRSDLDHVADELDAHRLGVAGREHVDDAAANGERAVLVDRILAREAGVDEQVGEVAAARSRCPTRISIDALQQPLGRADARQQRRRRRDDQPRRAGGGAVQRARARRRHPEVRRHAAIRDRPAATAAAAPRARPSASEAPSSARVEEPRVGRQLLDVLVRRHHEQRRRRCRARAAATAASALAAGVSPAVTGAGRSSAARAAAWLSSARSVRDVAVAISRYMRIARPGERRVGAQTLYCPMTPVSASARLRRSGRSSRSPAPAPCGRRGRRALRRCRGRRCCPGPSRRP